MIKPMLALMKMLDIEPVLLDVGATGGAPSLWEDIASRSTYVGFDPDKREMRDSDFGSFARTVIFSEAVTDDPAAVRIRFYLTRSPQCSSTLMPDTDALSQYLFSDSFQVEGETDAQAVTLEAALSRLRLPVVDWIKLDTQGTDLRLLHSLPAPIRSRVLAMDLEPGLIHAYQGEDLFVDAHRALTDDGFWLSRLPVRGSVRMGHTTREALLSLDARLAAGTLGLIVRPSPGWVEARYFRTIESLAERETPARDYGMLWIFALLDGQQGFALDVALAYHNRFGDDVIGRLMRDEPLRQLQSAYRRVRLRRAAKAPFRLLRQVRNRWKK